MTPAPSSSRHRPAAIALLALVVLCVAPTLLGWHGNLLVDVWMVASTPLIGTLGWRIVDAPLRDSVTWTLPLLALNAAILVIRPPTIVSFALGGVGAVWLAIFFSWSPVVPWWYQTVLRRPEPPALPDE